MSPACTGLNVTVYYVGPRNKNEKDEPRRIHSRCADAQVSPFPCDSFARVVAEIEHCADQEHRSCDVNAVTDEENIRKTDANVIRKAHTTGDSTLCEEGEPAV